MSELQGNVKICLYSRSERPGETVTKCVLSNLVANQGDFCFVSNVEGEQVRFVDGEMQAHRLKYYKYAAKSPLV